MLSLRRVPPHYPLPAGEGGGAQRPTRTSRRPAPAGDFLFSDFGSGRAAGARAIGAMPPPARRDLGGRRHNTPIESAQLMDLTDATGQQLSVRPEPATSYTDSAATEFIK